MKIKLSFLLIIIFSFFIQISTLARFKSKITNSDSLIDYFPLNIGNEWEYNYYWEFYDDPYLSPCYRSCDSGTVSVRIISQKEMIDSVVWSVQETKDLYYIFNSNKTHQPIKIDTFALVESMKGLHQLYLLADSETIRKSVFPLSPFFPDTALVHRYYDESSDSVIMISTIGWPNFNDFKLKQGVGLLSFYGTDGCTCMSGYDIHHTLIRSKITAVKNDTGNVFPNKYHIAQNYPNPFNSTTLFTFTIPKKEFITLEIYDCLGRKVARIISENLLPGMHSYQWDAKNLSSGIYFYCLRAGSYIETKKLVLLK